MKKRNCTPRGVLDETGELAQPSPGSSRAHRALASTRGPSSPDRRPANPKPGARTGYAWRPEGPAGRFGYARTASSSRRCLMPTIRSASASAGQGLRNRLPWPWTARSRTSGRPAATWRAARAALAAAYAMGTRSRATAATEPRAAGDRSRRGRRRRGPKPHCGRGTPDRHLRGRRRCSRLRRGAPGPGADPPADSPPGPGRGLRTDL